MTKKTIFDPELKIIVDKLKKRRLELGLTQSEVAQRLSKPQSFISKVEQRERRIDITELKSLAKVYKIEVKDLL